jgi:photosynthetic reaction center H subunit
MMRGAITSHIDVAQVVLYAFWIFFAGLIYYLRREDRREGYPLESEGMGRSKERGFLLIPTPKIFRLPHGGTVAAPSFNVDPRPVKGTKVAPWPGAPMVPNGDPMLAEIGPGAYALRADVPEKARDGRDLIVPMRVATNYAVAPDDGDPVGMAVIGADRGIAGTIRDLWVDRSESVLRYYEVEIAGDVAPKHVLLPVNFSRVDFARRQIKVDALLARQFAAVPALRDPDKITLLEEEKIMAYYGAGTLYATIQRAEPLL